MNYAEIKSHLKETYRYKIEMHAHTNPVSPCGKCSPKEVIQIYKDLGYQAICITNHCFKYLFDNQEIYQNMSKEEKIDQYINAFDEAKAEGEKLGINVILGAELRFVENENDYLIYGINRDSLLKIYDYLDGTVENFRKNCELPGTLFIQAHPFRSMCTPVSTELIDGIETFNSHIVNSIVPRAVRHAKENKVSITICGSDFHHPDNGNAGAAALLSKTLPEDSHDIVSILKSRDYIFEIGEDAIILP